MSDLVSVADAAVVQRRRFLRGGALAAAAAGGAVLATASSAVPASAATGDDLKLGALNDAGTATTGLSTSGEKVAALQLTNANGATLRLTSYGEEVGDLDLPIGSIVNSDYGPYISVSDGEGGTYLSYLATADDVTALTTTAPVQPRRIWDSKAKKGTVVGKSSSKAIDSKGRLVKGEWVDLRVAGTNEETSPVAAFLTLASSGSSKDGFFSAYLPGDRPTGTVSAFFLKGKTMSGTAYAALGVDGTSFTVRVYASQTTYVTVDLSGLTSYGFPGPDYTGAADVRRSGSSARRAAVRKARRAR
ncbi:hypothetical protein [Microlunatus antarcticus]|uniref:Uncharacterized protein n=1 Tax=Microlunatus antarcticus TaxID=53388 RepID=A0A7W5JSQ4_9ACTN|nr:hypothetical protein [Microlunatus antarcticus]MBB3325664.1 hypothetical protein [Microlunatus antarcticus]